MFCRYCGMKIPDSAKYCIYCGQKMEYDTSNGEENSYTTQSASDNVPPTTIIKEEPAHYLSPWGYVGYKILFSIPIVGFICLIIFSFNEEINLKNYARAHFCYALIIIGIFILLSILGVSDDVLEVIIDLITGSYYQ